jgi:hypothetical protein
MNRNFHHEGHEEHEALKVTSIRTLRVLRDLRGEVEFANSGSMTNGQHNICASGETLNYSNTRD